MNKSKIVKVQKLNPTLENEIFENIQIAGSALLASMFFAGFSNFLGGNTTEEGMTAMLAALNFSELGLLSCINGCRLTNQRILK